MKTVPAQRTPAGSCRPRPHAAVDEAAGDETVRLDGRRLLPTRLLLDPPVVVSLGGVLDGRAELVSRRLCHHLCPDMRAAADGRVGILVVLDAAGVCWIDEAGLAAVLSVERALAEAGHRLWLWAPSAVVLQALRAAGLDEDLQPVVD